MDSDCKSAGLSLSLTTTNLNNNNNEKKSSTSVISPMIMKFDNFLPCLSLAPAAADDHPISASPRLSSSYYYYNNNSGCMKRTMSFDQEEEEGSPRKKLRLIKHQSDVLEESFKHHSTLNPNQKQALAKQLNLRPRQVEVWFQNRRARTKLKQTENECEELKKQCEKLTEDNKRLQKELHELKNIQLFRLFMD